jgi:basic membrane lipoprotein Med (substrate-binding protein (PBP1-ABC) superfamily)/DNA-binding SARP family transcriptional activator
MATDPLDVAGYKLLGPLEVRSNGGAVDLGPPKQRALLAILLLHAGEVVSTERLIELVWGEDPPRTAEHSIQIYVSGLRKALEPIGADAALVTRTPGYLMQADPDSIDALRFRRLVAAGSSAVAADPERGAALLREALALWRGAPLSDFVYAEFASEPVRRLEELRLDAVEQLAAADLARGRAQDALQLVEAAIREDPLRERLRELQITALYRCGRQPDALRAYQTFRRLLDEELGLAPSPSLQRLNERVLLHDPSLAPEATTAPVPVRNPYKGLRPFAERDADDFFGRDGLVAAVLASLATGTRLVALVGPSGCGKSSALNAGVIPALRAGALPGSAEWTIATMMPGSQPFEQMERTLPDATAGPTLLAIDQFEELFSLTDETTAARFLRALASAVADGVTVVLTLRADFYDRPLQHGEFAALLTAGLVNVLPMAADELEAAVLAPARRVGVDVEPALLAELVADTTDQLGALPLLQYALTELFEARTGAVLSLEEYREAGGLRALLSRRSEEGFVALDDEQRQVAQQVFLRLVSLSEDARSARRRAPVRELTALDVDPVALSTVLEEFGRHRLVSFDRDPVAGDAVVEVAHEALLWEWERLAGWIETHREDLRRERSLAAAAAEWESTGRNPDYLIAGSRLAGYEAWSRQTTLLLTSTERAFLDRALAAEEERRDRQRRLERRAARRLLALAASLLVLVAAGAVGVVTWLGNRPPDAVLMFYGGDSPLDDPIEAGFDRAVSTLGVDAEKRVVAPLGYEAELRSQAERGVELIVSGGGPPQEDALDAVARDYPKTRFVAFSHGGERPNVAYVMFAEEQGSFLAGAAAALKSRTGVIGFIGGADYDEIWRFHAGYAAGARAVDPDIKVRAIYLTRPPDFSGFSSPTLARDAADRLYSARADVIYHAAGVSGYGLFESSRVLSERSGRRLWAIGVDSDQYRAIATRGRSEFAVPADARRNVLTSMLKRADRAAYTAVAEYARGALTPGIRRLGLESGGVELASSGGFIDDIRPELDRFRKRIMAGEIAVPVVPTSKVDAEIAFEDEGAFAPDGAGRGP